MVPVIRKPFFFVRHGSTEWNTRHLCQGWQDIPLNDQGRQEAKNAATLLLPKRIRQLGNSCVAYCKPTDCGWTLQIYNTPKAE